MRELIVAKADSTAGVEVDDCTIGISIRVPDFEDGEWEKRSAEYFEGQATEIVNALQTHLPGRTFDAVLRELLKRRACLLRVPIGS